MPAIAIFHCKAEFPEATPLRSFRVVCGLPISCR